MSDKPDWRLHLKALARFVKAHAHSTGSSPRPASGDPPKFRFWSSLNGRLAQLAVAARDAMNQAGFVAVLQQGRGPVRPQQRVVQIVTDWADSLEAFRENRDFAVQLPGTPDELVDLFDKAIKSTDAPAVTSEGLTDAIPLTWLREQVPQKKVKGDASKLAAWLRRKGVKIFKIAGKNHANREDLLRWFNARSNVCKSITEYDGDGE